jgi:hypothetical protein
MDWLVVTAASDLYGWALPRALQCFLHLYSRPFLESLARPSALCTILADPCRVPDLHTVLTFHRLSFGSNSGVSTLEVPLEVPLACGTRRTKVPILCQFSDSSRLILTR